MKEPGKQNDYVNLCARN